MKIHLRDLKQIIREAIEEAAGEVNMTSEPSTIKRAHDDLMKFASGYDIQYTQGATEPFKGASTLSPKASQVTDFESSAWSSLNPFEQYCLVAGYKGQYDVCDRILAAAGVDQGVWSSSGLAKKALMSTDYLDFVKHILGDDPGALSQFRSQKDKMIVGAAKKAKRR